MVITAAGAAPKRFGAAKTLMPGGLIPPEQIKIRGPRRTRFCGDPCPACPRCPPPRRWTWTKTGGSPGCSERKRTEGGGGKPPPYGWCPAARRAATWGRPYAHSAPFVGAGPQTRPPSPRLPRLDRPSPLVRHDAKADTAHPGTSFAAQSTRAARARQRRKRPPPAKWARWTPRNVHAPSAQPTAAGPGVQGRRRRGRLRCRLTRSHHKTRSPWRFSRRFCRQKRHPRPGGQTLRGYPGKGAGRIVFRKKNEE